jgi:AraC-like DNA-binding protein
MRRCDDIRLWRDASLPGRLELLRASVTNHRYPAHQHDEFVIAAFVRGAQRHRISSHSGIAHAGCVMVIAPGEVHTGEGAEVDRVWEYCAFYPSLETMADIAEGVIGGRAVSFGAEPLIRDRVLASHLLAAHRVAELSQDPLEKQSAVMEAFALLIRRYGQIAGQWRSPPPRDADISRALDLMNARYQEKLTVNEIAAAVGLSEYHFMRTFRMKTGMTLHGFVTQLRLRRAKDLLEDGVTPAEAAVAVGFFDQSHFTHTFRTHYGLTPKRFAQACR